jgi:hypothetical protein
MQTDKNNPLVFEYIWLQHADFGRRVWGLSGCLYLPVLNKKAISFNMQAFDRQSMKFYSKYFHVCYISAGSHKGV